MMLTHIDLFAGIGGFSVGFHRAGIQTVAYVEKDDKARALLQYHFPNAIHLNDVKTAGRHNLPYADVISFGSPCQDLSIAGKRKGLKGERSGLFWEAIRIVDECKPHFAIWENVPGALSSHSGRDFATVLSGFWDIGARDIAWRILDSQYFGVPQRRRRIFVVADFRGECAAEILFEQQGGEGDFTPRKKTGQSTTRTTGNGIKSYSRQRSDEYQASENASTLAARDYKSASDLITVTALGHTQSNGLGVYGQDIANTLEGIGSANQAITVGTLAASGAGTARPAGQGNELDFLVPMTFQYNAGASVGMSVSQDGIAQTLQVSDSHPLAVLPAANMGVRRLTPLEAERLQGFEDGWTAVNGQSDSTRYKQLGNAVTVNVAEKIGQRIVQTVWNEMTL